MSKVVLFLIDGFEEVEALASIDILRRGKVEVTTASLTGKEWVESKNGVQVKADALFEDIRELKFDKIVIPGGTMAYIDYADFMFYIKGQANLGTPIAAICAAPAVLGQLGLLQGRTATCYPGMEAQLKGAKVTSNAVEVDGSFTTGRGPGLAIIFALTVLEQLEGKGVAQQVAKDFLVCFP